MENLTKFKENIIMNMLGIFYSYIHIFFLKIFYYIKI